MRHLDWGLDGTTVLVTGGAGAIGRAICEGFAEAGARVAVADLDGAAAEAVAGPLGGAGFAIDLTRIADLPRLVAQVEARLGLPASLVNAAGIIRRNADYLSVTEEEWDAQHAVNLKAAFFLSQAVAARLIAAFAGTLFLLSSWWLARCVLGRGPAVAALVVMALNPFVVQYALYIGSDMPFAALCTLTLALLAQRTDRRSVWRLALAGMAAGCAFLVRHPGILLLPFGMVVALNVQRLTFPRLHVPRSTFHLLVFVLAFFIAIAPQMIVNIRDTGNPFYNQQAKNVWLAVYGDSDWGRWNEVGNDVALTEVILADPARFVGAWWSNLRTFIGAGAESAGDAGQASQLRLLAFPANWLAVIGIALGCVAVLRRRRAAAGG